MKFYLWKYTSPFGDVEAIMGLDENDRWLGIPYDPANTDYQAYLAWIAEGNEPEEWKAE